jgi:ParB family transcriptional regulator, chromosome partitioning protein
MNLELLDIPIREIKPFVSRARPRDPFERMKASIKEHGIKRPVQVRRIDDPKFQYERIVGEGRILACKELGLATVPAIVVEAPEGEIVGRFLTENVFRKRIPWQQKAELIRSEVGEEKPTKAEIERLSQIYFVTPSHIQKLLRILQQAAPSALETLNKLTVEEAETLTSLPAPGQDAVLETLKVEKLAGSDIPELVRKVRTLVAEGKPLSKTALRHALRRTDEDLDRLRKSLKLKRLHFALGPDNLSTLLADKTFRATLNTKGINYDKFTSTT